MFCITGIFKCFTPHEDARRATPRHATPRRPAIYASLSYDSFFLSFRLPNQPSSNFLASFVAVFPLLPLYSLLFFSLFSTDQQHPQSACANWSSPPARAKQLYPREEEKERKKYQFFSFEYLRRALGIKFSFFFFFFFLLFRPVYYYSILVCNLSLHGFHATCRCLPHNESARRLLNISRPTIGHRSVARYRRYYSANL